MQEDGQMTNHRGDQLLDFLRVAENRAGNDCFAPLTLVLVAARFNSRFVLVYNRERENWEIPGGHIEPGETAREAAVRELREETTQTAGRLHFEGILKLRPRASEPPRPETPPAPEGRIEYAAFYSTDLDELRPFRKSAEIAKTTLWDGRANIGPIDPIDHRLLNLISTGQETAAGQSSITAPPAVSTLPLVAAPFTAAALEDGSRIVDYVRSPDPALAAGLKFMQIVARYEERYLIVYVNRRGNWEFPAGGIEPGESWQDCALRELDEESGQRVSDPRLAMIVTGYFPKRGVKASGGIVTAGLTEIRPFQPTPEIGGIRLWDPRDGEECLDRFNRGIFHLVTEI